MKIGIFLGWGTLHPEAGGGHTFQRSLLQVLPDVATQHEFVIFYYGQGDLGFSGCHPELVSGSSQNNKKLSDKEALILKQVQDDNNKFSDANITFIPITPPSSGLLLIRLLSKPWRRGREWLIKKKYKTLLNKAALENNIDLMWFMTPGYEFVQVPYLYTIWDLQHRKQSFFPEVSVEGNQFEGREKLYASVIPRAAYVLTGNETAKKEVVAFYRIPAERVKTLELPTPEWALRDAPHGAPQGERGQNSSQKLLKEVPFVLRRLLEPSRSINGTHPYLFYPAQFWPHKNHVVLLRALALLKQEHGIMFDLVLTGSDKGNLSYVREQAEALGVHDQVHLLGFVSRDDLVALYQHAFALTFSSFFGPNNIPPLEGFALGCPVICARADGMQEQLGDAALFFDPCDEHALAATIMFLHDNPTERERLIAAGKQRAHAWTARDYVQQVVGIIDTFGGIRRCWGDQRAWVE